MCQPSRQARRRTAAQGFSLIELMIVLGILAVIIGLALPAILHAKKIGFITRQKADLALIETALNAYKTDFGDYPRFANPMDDQAAITNGTQGNGVWLDYKPSGSTVTDRGARLLCFALLSPGPDIAANHIGSISIANPGEDGAAGPGFRIRRNVVGGTSQLSGKVYGPYIDSSKFKLETSAPNFQDAKLLDGNGNPILYYPGAPSAASHVSTPFGYVATVDPSNYTAPTGGSATQNTSTPLYNSFDNQGDITPSANGRTLLKDTDMMLILGDTNQNGQIDASNSETATTTGPYLLWTAGPDGTYGLDSNGKTDDICNFDIPAKLQK